MDNNFAFQVADTAHLLRREFDRRAAALGVTRAQWRVLMMLSRQDGSKQVDLADALDVEPITLCRMVDRLVDAALVERRRDDMDRRAWRIHLTAAAGPVIGRLRALGETFLADALNGVSEKEQVFVLEALTRVRGNLAGGRAARKVS